MIYIKNMEDISEITKNKSYVLNKIIWAYKYMFNKITIRNFGNKQIYILPWKEEKNTKIKDRKLYRILKNANSNKVEDKYAVLSESLNKEERITKILYKNYLKILDGRWLFNVLNIDILKYITKSQNRELKEQTVAILVNNPNEITLTSIKNLAQEIKNLKIVTNNCIYFKRIETKLYEEMGIPIQIANNKRKSLLNSDIILNVDFTEKEINQYSINKKCIIINIYNKVKNLAKSFDGINVNWYKIKMKNEYIDLLKEYNLYNQFDINILYESFIYSKEKSSKVKKRIEKDNLKIDYLIGTKGKILKEEYLKFSTIT